MRSAADSSRLKTTERREVLAGTDFVINSLAIERCELWKRISACRRNTASVIAWEKTAAPALFFTMRTFPVIMDIIHDMGRNFAPTHGSSISPIRKPVWCSASICTPRSSASACATASL